MASRAAAGILNNLSFGCVCVCVLEGCWRPTSSVTECHRETFFSIPVTNQPKSSAREDMLPF